MPPTQPGGAAAACALETFDPNGQCGLDVVQGHGLLRSRGLVAEGLRRLMATTAAVNYGGNVALVVTRDPGAATAARLRQKKDASAQEAADRDRRMAEVGRSGRRGTVVVCAFCGAAFCP